MSIFLNGHILDGDPDAVVLYLPAEVPLAVLLNSIFADLPIISRIP